MTDPERTPEQLADLRQRLDFWHWEAEQEQECDEQDGPIP